MTLPAFNHHWVDETHAPVYITRDPELMTDEAQASYLKRLEVWIGEVREPYSRVVIPGRLSPRQRKILSEALKRMRPRLEKYQIALAFVLPNAAVRGILSAVFWLSPPFNEYRVFADLAAALRWAQQTHAAKCPPVSSSV